MDSLATQAYAYSPELRLDDLMIDATALFEQYEPSNDSEPAVRIDDTCENLYTLPR